MHYVVESSISRDDAVHALEMHIRGQHTLAPRFIPILVTMGLLSPNDAIIYRGISDGRSARKPRNQCTSWSKNKRQAIAKSKSYSAYDGTDKPRLDVLPSGGFSITKKGYWVTTGSRFSEEQEVIVVNAMKEHTMRIKINEQRFKQIVREELAIAKLGSRLHEEQAQPPVQTQQAQSDMARRKKQYTCRCSAKFMDYENVKGAPLCPKCNDAEVKATGQSQQQPTHEAAKRSLKQRNARRSER